MIIRDLGRAMRDDKIGGALVAAGFLWVAFVAGYALYHLLR